jgi:hypothetical protein
VVEGIELGDENPVTVNPMPELLKLPTTFKVFAEI